MQLLATPAYFWSLEQKSRFFSKIHSLRRPSIECEALYLKIKVKPSSGWWTQRTGQLCSSAIPPIPYIQCFKLVKQQRFFLHSFAVANRCLRITWSNMSPQFHKLRGKMNQQPRSQNNYLFHLIEKIVQVHIHHLRIGDSVCNPTSSMDCGAWSHLCCYGSDSAGISLQ